MAQKKLEKGSQYEKYDLDGDGIVTDEEFEMDEKLLGKKIIQNGIYIKKLIKAVQKMSSGIVIFHALLTTM